jgi:hypothetical protein
LNYDEFYSNQLEKDVDRLLGPIATHARLDG